MGDLCHNLIFLTFHHHLPFKIVVVCRYWSCPCSTSPWNAPCARICDFTVLHPLCAPCLPGRSFRSSNNDARGRWSKREVSGVKRLSEAPTEVFCGSRCVFAPRWRATKVDRAFGKAILYAGWAHEASDIFFNSVQFVQWPCNVRAAKVYLKEVGFSLPPRGSQAIYFFKTINFCFYNMFWAPRGGWGRLVSSAVWVSSLRTQAAVRLCAAAAPLVWSTLDGPVGTEAVLLWGISVGNLRR